MKVSIHTASLIGTWLAVARVSRVRVRLWVIFRVRVRLEVLLGLELGLGLGLGLGLFSVVVFAFLHFRIFAFYIFPILMPVCDDLRSVNST